MLRLALASYNGKTGLMVCCPMSTKVKGHPFEVVLEIDGVASAVLSDQVSSLDWKTRRAKKKAIAPSAVMAHVMAKTKAY
jgi:mRNA interferase MazF